MFGLSIGEIFFIIITVLIFVKPNEFPEFIANLKFFFKSIRKLFSEANKQYNIIQEELGINEVAKDIDIDAVNHEVKEILGDDGKKYLSYDVKKVLNVKNGQK